MVPWLLGRSPLSPAVPVDGSDTVEGLASRLLELDRRRLAEQRRGGGGGGNTGGGGGWRRSYSRYRGPFIEQLSTDDLQRAPKSWDVFWRGGERGRPAQAYSLPATLAVLRERVEENLVSFLPNYLRLGGAAFLATFYLRPKALLGAAAVLFSTYRSAAAAWARQQQEAAAAQQQQQQQGGRQAPARGARAGAGWAAATADADATDQLSTVGLTVVTWLLVAYTRCLPMLLLACGTSAAAVLLHCSLYRAPSEYRHKGRQALGYTWRQVLGRERVPEGANPRALLWEAAAAGWETVVDAWHWGQAYCRHCTRSLTRRLFGWWG